MPTKAAPRPRRAVKKAPAAKAAGIGTAAVAERTGKSWDQWFAILDRAGAQKLSHPEIVAHLVKGHAVAPWWRQMITVEYERARGLRAKHEAPAGFSISRSKTVAAPIADAFAAWSDTKRRGRWLGATGLVVRKATPPKSLRITWTDAKSSVEVMLYAKGADRTQVVVQHSKLAGAQAGEQMKRYWGEALERMEQAL